MESSNQYAYQTIGNIINHSEKGLFLLIAEEEEQKEIKSIYRNSGVKIFDYKEQGGIHYSFEQFQDWLQKFSDLKTVLILNLQLAVQGEVNRKRLNFSRDMLARLNKNLIFTVNRYGDDLLARDAFDFYSYIKFRIYFTDEEEWREVNENAAMKPEKSCLPDAAGEGADRDGMGKTSGESSMELLKEAVRLSEQADN